MRYACKIILFVSALSCIVGCNMTDFRGYEHVKPLKESVEPINKAQYVAYLDTAAIDDWEGLWLLMGTDGNCYVILERMNDFMHGSFYTHRVRLWSGNYGQDALQSGTVIGYLEQGISDDVKRITLFDGYILPRRNFSSYIRMDNDCRYIIFGTAQNAENKSSEYNRMGMMRIYPRRSSEEQDYKVRYL